MSNIPTRSFGAVVRQMSVDMEVIFGPVCL